ncbi:MAG: tetratricopeptide repeat protein, partial [Bacteroidota bacterium]
MLRGSIYRLLTVLITVSMLGCGAPKTATQSASRADANRPAANNLSPTDSHRLMRTFFEANREKILGNFDQAELLFEQCLKIDPNHGASLYELSRFSFEAKRFNMALDYAQKANKADPENEWYQVMLAESYNKLGRFKEGVKVYEKLSKAYPTKLEYHYEWANALIYNDQYKDAIAVYNRIEQQTGISEELSVQKQKLHLKNDDWELAVAEIRALVDAFPREPRYYGMLAELYQREGKTKETLATYEELLKLDPDNPYILLSMADYYKAAGEDDKAFEALSKAFANGSMDIDGKVQILLNYYAATESGLNRGTKKEAFTLSKILVEAHPEDPKANSIYGDFLFRDKRFEEARNQYREAIRLDNSRFMLWNQLLIIESELNDVASMLSESKEAMELFPSQPSFYFFNGAAHLQQQDYTAAVDALEQGVDLVFDNPFLLAQFHASLGDAYYNLKDYTSSDENYDKALEVDSKNLYVLNNYSYYLSLRNEKLEKAERMSRICIEAQPNSASYLDTYAWIRYQQGDLEDARYYMEQALNHGGANSGVILEHYGDILFKSGEQKKALEYWQRAKDKGDGSEFLEQKVNTG